MGFPSGLFGGLGRAWGRRIPEFRWSSEFERRAPRMKVRQRGTRPEGGAVLAEAKCAMAQGVGVGDADDATTDPTGT